MADQQTDAGTEWFGLTQRIKVAGRRQRAGSRQACWGAVSAPDSCEKT
jgi:hypothetical protein